MDQVPELRALQIIGYQAFVTALLGGIAYGVHACVACTSMCLIFKTWSQHPLSRFNFTFIAILLFLSTVHIGLWGFGMSTGFEMVFLPPSASVLYDMPASFIRAGASCGAMSIIMTSLCQGLLLYRCYIMWEKYKYIIIIPALLYLSSFGSSTAVIALNWKYRRNLVEIPVPLVPRLTDFYWYNLLGLNVLLSLLIVVRLVYLYRRHLRAFQTGSVARGSRQTNSNAKSVVRIAIAVIIESSLLYSIVTIIGIGFNWWFFPWVPFEQRPAQTWPLRDGTDVTPFHPFLANIECIAADFIILRIALGRAWSNSNTQVTSTRSIQFGSRREVDVELSASDSSTGLFSSHAPNTPSKAVSSASGS